MSRVVYLIADTSYLVCFGAAKAGRKYLSELFAGGVGVPPAVRNELAGLSAGRSGLRIAGRTMSVDDAARTFTGTGAASLVDVDLEPGDEEERDLALKALGGSGTDNLGESECIAICVRSDQVLLINDGPATDYGRSRGVTIEGTAHSLRRIDSLSPKQKFALAREMEREVGNIGYRVPGHQWFAKHLRPPSMRLPNGGGA